MTTKMSVKITMAPKGNTDELVKRLQTIGVEPNVVGNGIVQVDTIIDIRENTIEKILEAFNEFGDPEVKAHMV